MDFIKSLLEVLAFPLLCITIRHVIEYLKFKRSQMEVDAEKVKYQTYLDEALEAIYKSVKKVNQTFVDTLKAQGKFDAEAQSQAFATAWEDAIILMGKEAVEFLMDKMDDFELWMEVQVEAAVNDNK